MSQLNLRKGETPEAGVKRILSEELQDIIHRLENFNNPNEDIHEVRKNLKEIRALLRLVRKEVGEEAYKKANITFRDAGRLLSDVRDSWVLYQTVQILAQRFEELLADDAFQVISNHLKARHTSFMQEFMENDTRADILSLVKGYRPFIADLPIATKDFGAFYGGIKKVYQRGSEAANLALSNATTHNLHDWRKRVKYLYYQMGYLRDLWPEELMAFEESLNQLSDLLGQDHDMAVLQETLTQMEAMEAYPKRMELLLGIVTREQQRLQDQLWPLAARVYEEDPEDFAKRLSAYWEALRMEVD